MAVAETRQAPARTETQKTEKGVSLARGPALILGTILLAAGLYSLYKQHTFPPFSNFPNGKAPIGGKLLHTFGANGWTGMLTAVAGGLLLFGAAAHLLAKTMSLIVGLALGTAAVISLISGDVLGMAAANHLTELAWGIAAAILLFNTLIPRRRRKVEVAEDSAVTGGAGNGTGAGYGRSRPAAAPARDREAALAGDRELAPAGDHEMAPAAEREGAPAPVGDRAGSPVDGDGAETRPLHDDAADTRVAGDQAQTRPLQDDAADTRVRNDQAATNVSGPERRRPEGEGGTSAA